MGALAGAVALLWGGACTPAHKPAADAGVAGASLTLEELMDPAQCIPCHANHHTQWAGSMHAYAAADPVFRAMNQRGQEATGGALGTFCVACHAPMAVKLGLTQDGLNLDSVPAHLQGITCFYCHQVEQVHGTYNNPLSLAMDGVMRGGFQNPVSNSAHASAYSPLHARDEQASASLCGSCHDIVTATVALERTFSEWQHSLYSQPAAAGGLTCNACHMDGSPGYAVTQGSAPMRRVHSHAWPGVDVALTEFPGRATQQALVTGMLNTALLGQLCVSVDGTTVELGITLENIAAGHSFPSGAAQDRRVWVEINAWKDNVNVFTTGALAAGEDITHTGDPFLWLLRDKLYDAAGVPTHQFWAAATIESDLLPAPTARDPTQPGYTPTHRVHTYQYRGGLPDRVEMQVHVQPVGQDVLNELVDHGYLDGASLMEMPVFNVAATALTWNAAGLVRCVGAATPRP